MTTLTHWNPFKQTSRFEPIASFDDLFRGWGVRPMAREFDVAPEIRIDVSEDDKLYRIKADIPGLDKNDIQISVEGNQVSIGAEIRREMKKKDDEKELYTERYFGKVFRSFSLPVEVDSAKAEAHYENGVLMLQLPKKSNGGTRKITVS
jgi:HSP20 family protein